MAKLKNSLKLKSQKSENWRNSENSENVLCVIYNFQ
jgi:hypothetical protein